MNLETTLQDVVPLAPEPEKRSREVEELLSLSRLAGQRESDSAGPWDVVTGTGILFSAPHEVTHIRDGVEKKAERGTGALAFALARYTNGAGLATVLHQTGDPNWDMKNPYVMRAQA